MTGMDFTSAADRARGLISQKRPGRLAESALAPNVLRDNLIREAEEHTPRFHAAAGQTPTVNYEVTNEDGSKETRSFEWSTYGELVRDVARAGFDYDEPELARPDSIRESHRFNRDVLAEFMASDGFRESRPYTRDNEVESMFGALAVGDVLRESAAQIAGHIANSEQVREQEQAVQSAQDMIDQLRARAKAQHDAGQPIDPNLAQQMKNQIAQRQAAKQALGQAIAQAKAQRAQQVQTARALGQKMGQAQQEATELAGALPGLESAMGSNMSPDQRLELAEMWRKNPQLKAIARMTGRLIRDMRFKRQARTKNVKIEPTGITTGRDLDVMLPHEWARAFHSIMKPLWIKDYAARSLLQYDMEGKAPAGKGPIVYVYDGSGSMSGENFIWAISLGLALMSIAQREKRTFAAVQFSGPGNVRTWEFPKNKSADMEKVMDFATFFFGGGTVIAEGMREAHRIVTSVEGYKSADIILTTDGFAGYGHEDEQLRDELRALGVRIHGISIQSPGCAYLTEMCDYPPVDVQDLAGSNEATDTVAEMIT